MNCYDDAIGPSNYTVIPPFGTGQADMDSWTYAVSQAFVAAGWSVQTIATIAILQMNANYFPSFQDASWDISDFSPYWDLNGLDIHGQPIMVDGVPGQTIPSVANLPPPYYYAFIFPNGIYPGTIADRGTVIAAVFETLWAPAGWVSLSSYTDSVTGDVAMLLTLPGTWPSAPTLDTGLAINCNPTTGASFGGGFICTSLGPNPISIYITSGPGVANVVTNYIEIGIAIPNSPTPWTAGFIANSPFEQYGIFGAVNKGKTSTNLTPFPGADKYTILIITPTSFVMHTQSDKDQSPTYWAIGTPILATPNTPMETAGFFCGRGTGAGANFRTSFACEPDSWFIEYMGNHNSDGDPGPYGCSRNLYLSTLGRGQRLLGNSPSPILWEGDGLNPGPGEISDPWVSINVLASPNPIVGYITDCFCTTDVIVSPDTTSAIDWDNHTWIPYTQNNLGQQGGPPGTIFFRVDNVNGSPWIPPKVRLSEREADVVSFQDGSATVTSGPHGLIQIDVTF
jgi:hypothetical protein